MGLYRHVLWVFLGPLCKFSCTLVIVTDGEISDQVMSLSLTLATAGQHKAAIALVSTGCRSGKLCRLADFHRQRRSPP